MKIPEKSKPHSRTPSIPFRVYTASLAPNEEAQTASPPKSIEFLRRHLGNSDALPQLVALAIVSGTLTALVILAFRLLIDYPLTLWLGDAEAFETLGYLQRASLPLAGAFVIGLALSVLGRGQRRVGVPHVMACLSERRGRLPASNALVQFFGGAAALLSGQSGGREGPAIHLGAATASLLGQWLRLPNDGMRTLVACGTAAALASSFNTPIAGVIFAMEVVMMEYTIANFLPVIIAAVAASLTVDALLGTEPPFTVALIEVQSLPEVPQIILAGLVIGCLAAGFNLLIQQFARLNQWPFLARVTLAGGITGLAALAAPGVLGIGYDTLNSAMLGELAVGSLIALAVLKLVTNAAAFGLGLPVGLIGPALVIGGCAGGAIGGFGLASEQDASVQAFYVMLGMAAMMAAVLRAPLAALMAVVEMTLNANLILPAMLIIAVAMLTTNEVFKHQSPFLTTVRSYGVVYPPNPAVWSLTEPQVATIMNPNIERLPWTVGRPQAEAALARGPAWILFEGPSGDCPGLLNAADLRTALGEYGATGSDIDLRAFPAVRRNISEIDADATVDEAEALIGAGELVALIVRADSSAAAPSAIGIVTEREIDRYRALSS